MPVQGEFHSKYWANRAANPPPPAGGTTNPSMYPCWQVNVTRMVIFGLPMPPGWWQTVYQTVRWYWRLFQHVRSLSAANRALLWQAVERAEYECAEKPVPLPSAPERRRVLEIKRLDERPNKSIPVSLR